MRRIASYADLLTYQKVVVMQLTVFSSQITDNAQSKKLKPTRSLECIQETKMLIRIKQRCYLKLVFYGFEYFCIDLDLKKAPLWWGPTAH